MLPSRLSVKRARFHAKARRNDAKNAVKVVAWVIVALSTCFTESCSRARILLRSSWNMRAISLPSQTKRGRFLPPSPWITQIAELWSP